MAQVLSRVLMVAAVVLATACSMHVTSVQPSEEIEGAVARFLEAVQNEDVEEMSRLWGTKDGPMVGRLDQDALEMRLRVMQIYLQHDSFELEPVRNAVGLRGSEIGYRLTIHRGACADMVPVTMVRWRDQWLVQSVNLDEMQNPARPCSGG